MAAGSEAQGMRKRGKTAQPETCASIFLPARLSGICLRAELEIHFNRLNEWHQPAHQFLMHRMRAVTVEGSLVGEFHHTSKLVALSTRGNIHADGFPPSRGSFLAGREFQPYAQFLLFRHAR